jgi:hypothetical protein
VISNGRIWCLITSETCSLWQDIRIWSPEETKSELLRRNIPVFTATILPRIIEDHSSCELLSLTPHHPTLYSESVPMLTLRFDSVCLSIAKR